MCLGGALWGGICSYRTGNLRWGLLVVNNSWKGDALFSCTAGLSARSFRAGRNSALKSFKKDRWKIQRMVACNK